MMDYAAWRKRPYATIARFLDARRPPALVSGSASALAPAVPHPTSSVSSPSGPVACILSRDCATLVPVQTPRLPTALERTNAMQHSSFGRKRGEWRNWHAPACGRTAAAARARPPRPKTHWDYLLEEMAWLAQDFANERKWKNMPLKRRWRHSAERRMSYSSEGLRFAAKEIKVVEWKRSVRWNDAEKLLWMNNSVTLWIAQSYSQQLAAGMSHSGTSSIGVPPSDAAAERDNTDTRRSGCSAARVATRTAGRTADVAARLSARSAALSPASAASSASVSVSASVACLFTSSQRLQRRWR
ncbi:Helicase SRCAP [Eumeta japonica]|uniref:Helicase SRCAP n=1 Tax=Eumeta variegata TaxID=151549 RepID=A0A4C2AEN8_EUMVA|nr:Helicase SRCAP [Eumeta japonica]